MIVKLFDKTELHVTDKEGEAIARALANKTEIIVVKGTVIKTSAIAYVKPGQPSTLKSLPVPDNRREPSPAKEKIKQLLKQGYSFPEIAKQL